MKSLNIRRSKIFSKLVVVHICCWLAYIFYEQGFLFYSYGKMEPLQVIINYYSVNILFFYGHVSLMKFIFDRPFPKYFMGILIYVALLIVYLSAKYYTSISQIMKTDGSGVFDFKEFLSSALFRAGYFTLLATFYWAANHISHFRKQAANAERLKLIALKDKAELETRLAESKNAYLEQQINPHLLFNTLNFIYNSVYQQSREAAKCVVLLSDIMRFSLEETGEDGKVSLSSEIEQVQRLVQINQYRYDKPLALEVKLEGDSTNYRIIPLILFTLTENVFKHGQLLNPAFPAAIHVIMGKERRLNFYTINLIKSKNEPARRRSVGLDNVRIRLDYAYPGKYELLVSQTGDFYELTLNLQL
jgi:two-component system LytT family sensor kinase